MYTGINVITDRTVDLDDFEISSFLNSHQTSESISLELRPNETPIGSFKVNRINKMITVPSDNWLSWKHAIQEVLSIDIESSSHSSSHYDEATGKYIISGDDTLMSSILSNDTFKNIIRNFVSAVLDSGDNGYSVNGGVTELIDLGDLDDLIVGGKRKTKRRKGRKHKKTKRRRRRHSKK
jgi:hypothetical protein